VEFYDLPFWSWPDVDHVGAFYPGGHSMCCHYPMCILSIKERPPYCRLPIFVAPPPIADRLRNPTPYCWVKGSIPRESGASFDTMESLNRRIKLVLCMQKHIIAV
jgi:hypothetical protein